MEILLIMLILGEKIFYAILVDSNCEIEQNNCNCTGKRTPNPSTSQVAKFSIKPLLIKTTDLPTGVS